MYLNSNAQIRPELSAVVEDAAFADNYFIGLKVFPAYNSAKKTGEFMKITQAASEVQKANVTDRAQKSPYGKVDRTYEKDNFACADRGLEEDLDDSVTAELVDFFSTEQVTSKLLLRSMLIDHETRVAAAVFNTGNFDANNSAVAYTEANIATIDFARDVQNAVKLVRKRGEDVNTMILNRDVWDRVRRSTLLASFFFGPQGGGKDITTAMVSEAFGIKNILIADATVDTSKKGQTAAAGYIWSNTYVWIGNVQSGDFSAGGAGRTITWTGDASSLFVTETYRKEEIRSDCIRVRQHTAEKVVSTPSGTLVTTQYA